MMELEDVGAIAGRKITPGGEFVVKVQSAFSDTRAHMQSIIEERTMERDMAQVELAEMKERLSQLLEDIRKYGPTTVVQG